MGPPGLQPNVQREGHAAWVRLTHAITALAVLTLTVSGIVILMAHPRLYWGEVGNDLTTPLLELPISPGYSSVSWTLRNPLDADPAAADGIRLEEPFNENGWARSLHFLAAWWFVVPGLVYAVRGVTSRHFVRHLLPARDDLRVRNLRQDVLDHLRLRIPQGSGGPRYGALQKAAYCFVIFVAAPVLVLTGLTMSPAVTVAFPVLLTVFGGVQSARTIHFFAFLALLLFTAIHVLMVVKSGFGRQIRSITTGERV